VSEAGFYKFSVQNMRFSAGRHDYHDGSWKFLHQPKPFADLLTDTSRVIVISSGDTLTRINYAEINNADFRKCVVPSACVSDVVGPKESHFALYQVI
jgi:hypothetical protein